FGAALGGGEIAGGEIELRAIVKLARGAFVLGIELPLLAQGLAHRLDWPAAREEGAGEELEGAIAGRLDDDHAPRVRFELRARAALRVDHRAASEAARGGGG